MGFSSDIYTEARNKTAARKAKAEDEAMARREAFNTVCPQYSALARKLSRNSAMLAMEIFRNGNGSVDIERYKSQSLSLQAKMHALLAEHGYDENYLEPDYSCKQCGDSGTTDSGLCSCVTSLMRKIAYDRLNAVTPLSNCRFDNFSLEYYSDTTESGGSISPRKAMEITFGKCRAYAAGFSLGSPSLLFQGGVGLGKTHLSLAIAGAVIEKGYGVIYGSANNLFSRIEAEHFGKAASSVNTQQLLKECDLLIIDDLGAEFVTQFTISVLYDIINTRMLCGIPTIISTNLDRDGLEQKYTDRLFSRLSGSFRRFRFTGTDMRIILRKAKRSTDG